MKKKKKYTKYEKLHFLHDYKESGLSLNEYCIRNNINYYEMKAWLLNYKSKIKDAGRVIDTRVNNPKLSNYKATQIKKDETKKLLRFEQDNSMVCFTIQEKKKAILLKKENSNTNIAYQVINTSNNPIEEMFNFRENINKCCMSLLDLQFNKANTDLIKRLMEVLK
jgi:hypothetical protein